MMFLQDNREFFQMKTSCPKSFLLYLPKNDHAPFMQGTKFLKQCCNQLSGRKD